MNKPKKKPIILFGKYLTPIQRKKNFLILLIIFLGYAIIQGFLVTFIRRPWVFAFNVIPTLCAAILLGTWAPLLMAVALNLYIPLLIYFSGSFSAYEAAGPVIFTLTAIISMAIGRLSDLTRKARASEKALIKDRNDAEEANRVKSEFLAHISHEIRTPMNSILGFAELAKDEPDLEKRNDKLDIIIKSGNSLLNLINDLLDLGKIEAGKLGLDIAPFSMAETVKSVQNLFLIQAREKQNILEVRMAPSFPHLVSGDERRLRQIIINLVGNAVKFTNQGKISIDCSYHDGKVLITINDTGIGIPADKLEIIFSAFGQVYTSMDRQYNGTGLGLAISAELVNKMDGIITVKSELNSGSTFTVELPLPAISQKEADKFKQDQNIITKIDVKYIAAYIFALKKKGFVFKTLIADDNMYNRDLLKHYINDINLSLDSVDNGEETLKMLNTAVALNKKYDLLLLDMQMPLMSGPDVVKILRESNTLKDTYVIAVTAHAIQDKSEQYLKAGCDFFISKPVDKTILLNKIFDLIQAKSGKQYSVVVNPSPPASFNTDRIELSEPKKQQVIKIISALKRNEEILNPPEIQVLIEQLETMLPERGFNYIQKELQAAVTDYDDALLSDGIRKLEKMINY